MLLSSRLLLRHARLYHVQPQREEREREQEERERDEGAEKENERKGRWEVKGLKWAEEKIFCKDVRPVKNRKTKSENMEERGGNFFRNTFQNGIR